MNDEDFELLKTHALVHHEYLNKIQELESHLREYLDVMKDEPADSLIPLKDVYHDLKRMLGDEE